VLPDLAVSPDGAYIYYSTLEVSVRQIRMIEGSWYPNGIRLRGTEMRLSRRQARNSRMGPLQPIA